MSKSPNQKLKFLYLARILISKTDEAHALSLEEVKNELLSYDVQAERKRVIPFGVILFSIGSDTLE